MMQFTEEQKVALIEFNRAIITQHESYAVPESSWPDEVRLLVSSARIALAALTAEPVAYIIQDASDRAVNGKGRLSWHSAGAYSPEDINEYEVSSEPLYTTPPAPALRLPDEWTLADAEKFISDMTPPTEEEAALFARNGLLDEIERLNATAPQPVKLPDVEKWRSPEAVRAQNAYRVLVKKQLADAGYQVEE